MLALTDRASRGLSLVPGFKSKQEKTAAKNVGPSVRTGTGNDRSPVPVSNERRSTQPPTQQLTNDDDIGGCGHLTKLVLKFTTASESDVQPSCEIGTDGASIGRSEQNTVSIPSDTMLAPLHHAIVRYEGASSLTTQRKALGEGEGEGEVEDAEEDQGETLTDGQRDPEASEGTSVTGGGGVCQEGGRSAGGGFYFSDGGQQTDFSAALRIRVGEGNREWPLTHGSHFSAGLTVFRAHHVPPPENPDDVHAGDEKHDGNPMGDLSAEGGDNHEDVDAGEAITSTGLQGEAGEKPASNGDTVGQASGLFPEDEETQPKRIACLWLEALAGCLKGQVWEVGPTGGTLGRASDNTLSLADKEMSRRHSKIEYDKSADEFYLCDLGSLNGTYMQMVGPYAPHRRLALGDHVLVGRTGFSVNRYDYGISERVGARPTMEDRSTVIQDLGLSSLGASLLWPQTFAAVYDGHGGGQASEYLWANLHIKVTESLAARSDRLLAAATAAAELAQPMAPSKAPGLLARAANLRRKPFGGDNSGGISSGDGGPWEALDEVVREALREAFAIADKEFIATSSLPEAGSTATTCLVLGSRLYIANVGDSRTVLCRGGKLRLASQDHKPSRADEQERVHRAGGFVAHRRVMGELAVSRAFGDLEFKSKPTNTDMWGGGLSLSGRDGDENGDEDATPLIIAEPEFLVSEILPQDNFVVLACDGIFDVLTSEEVVSNVIEKMKIHGDAQRCCEDLTEKAIVERRTRDNVSLVLVVFNKWY